RLERVRTGDIRQREPLRVSIAEADPRLVETAEVVVAEGRRLLRDGDVVGARARHQQVWPVKHHVRRAGLEQQLAGQRRRPRALDDAIRPEPPRRLALERAVGAAAERRRGATAGADAILLDVGEDVDLVALRDLPRKAYGMRLVLLVAERRTGEVRGIDGRSLRLVPVEPRGLVAHAPAPDGGEEPHLVLLDRPADREPGVVHPIQLRYVGDGTVAERRRQVAALQVVVGEQALDAEPEG